MAAPGLVIEASSVPSCFSVARLEAALLRRVGAHAGRVALQGAGSSLTVSLERQGYPSVMRTVAFRDEECAELPQTIALLVLSWWKVSAPLPTRPPPDREAPGVHTSPPPEPAPQVAPGSDDAARATLTGAQSDGRGGHATISATDLADDAVLRGKSSTRQAQGTDVTRSPPSQPLPPAPLLSAAPLTVAEVPAPPSEAPSEAPSEPAAEPGIVAELPESDPATAAGDEGSSWLVAAELGGQAGFDGTLTGGGRLALEAGRVDGLGAVLDVGLESARVTALPGVDGRVVAWLAWASLLARYRFDLESWAFVVGLGARVFRVAAGAQGAGIDQPRALDAYVPAAVLTVQLQRELGAGLFVTATLQGFLRAWEQSLEIQGLAQPAARIPLGGASAALGLGYRFK